jgi:hypothetical protein
MVGVVAGAIMTVGSVAQAATVNELIAQIFQSDPTGMTPTVIEDDNGSIAVVSAAAGKTYVIGVFRAPVIGAADSPVPAALPIGAGEEFLDQAAGGGSAVPEFTLALEPASITGLFVGEVGGAFADGSLSLIPTSDTFTVDGVSVTGFGATSGLVRVYVDNTEAAPVLTGDISADLASFTNGDSSMFALELGLTDADTFYSLTLGGPGVGGFEFGLDVTQAGNLNALPPILSAFIDPAIYAGLGVANVDGRIDVYGGGEVTGDRDEWLAAGDGNFAAHFVPLPAAAIPALAAFGLLGSTGRRFKRLVKKD